MKKTLALLLLLAGLTVEAQAATDLIWNGSEGHMTWNFEDDNWLQGDTPAQYIDGNDVVFGYTGCGTVTLSDTLEPASVKVGPSYDYTFTGDGKLTGGMQLTIDNCTLTVNTANDYTGGTIIKLGSTLVVGDDKALGTGAVTLDGSATLDLGGHVLSNDVVTVTSSRAIWCIGNGTLNGNISVASNSCLLLIGNLSGTGRITLGDNTVLELAGCTLSNSVTLQGSASIRGGGTLSGDLTVGEGVTLRLDNPEIASGTIYLDKNSTLDLCGKTLNTNVVLTRDEATITAGTLNGNITVRGDRFLNLGGDLEGAGTIVLEDYGYLYLEGHTLSTHVTMQGSEAYIGGGTLNSDLYVGAGARLMLVSGNMQGSGVITLGDNATLHLGGIRNLTLSNRVILEGSATIGNGTLDGSIRVGANNKLTLLENTTITGAINLGDHAALDLGGNTFHLDGEDGNKLVLNGSISIGNGTIEGSINVAANDKLTLLGNTTITGAINLGDHAALDLGGNTFHLGGEDGNKLVLNGSISAIGNGTVKLLADLTGEGTIVFGEDTMVDMNGYTLSTGNAVILEGDATIGNGTLNRDITVETGNKLTLCGAMDGAGIINLKAESTLDLNQYALSNMLLVGDSVTIGNGALNVDVRLGGQMQLNLCGDLGGTGVIHLDNGTTLNLGGHTLTKEVSVHAGNSTTIANGTVKLLADLTGEGTIVFGEDTMVDMNGYTLSQAFSLAGDTTFTNGKVRLTDNVSGEGTFILGEGVTLDTNFRTISNKITLSGSTVTILGGNFDNDLTVGKGQTLIVTGTSMTGKGTLYLGDGATLRQKPTPISSYITNAVMVTGNATIDNGNLSSWVTVAPGVKLTVSGSLNMANSSSIALQDGAILDLGGGSDINARVYVGGDAFVGNGCVNKEILVNSLRKLTLFDSLTCIDIGSQETSTGITLQNNAAVDLGGKTHIIDVRAYGNASIGNGTLDGSVTANHDSSLNFFGETRIKGGTQIPGGTQNPDKTATSGLVTVGNTTIKSLDNANPGLLKELSVSNGLIAGTDRCTSLADGLYIESTADLMIKNMTITANNELHAGYMLLPLPTNIVTLNQVTIDLSEANFKLVGSDYYFQVQDLINCTLKMDDVVFDASGLELPEDFDPAENGIGFDFGTDVTIDPQTAKNLTLLMGDYLSTTANLGTPGQVLFTALVPIPEPATGTLSLLALAALASRRRRK